MNFTGKSLLHLTLLQFGATLTSVLAFTPAALHNNVVNGEIISPTSSTLFAAKYGKDTASTLPPFSTKEEYIEYITSASALPKGFSTGSAVGSFIPEEAPSMGKLPIKATIIHLDDGPTDNWAATFTQNMVCTLYKQKAKFYANFYPFQFNFFSNLQS
jgi:hypothetical protein